MHLKIKWRIQFFKCNCATNNILAYCKWDSREREKTKTYFYISIFFSTLFTLCIWQQFHHFLYSQLHCFPHRVNFPPMIVCILYNGKERKTNVLFIYKFVIVKIEWQHLVAGFQGKIGSYLNSHIYFLKLSGVEVPCILETNLPVLISLGNAA